MFSYGRNHTIEAMEMQNPKIKSGNLFKDSWSAGCASEYIFLLLRIVLVVQEKRKKKKIVVNFLVLVRISELILASRLDWREKQRHGERKTKFKCLLIELRYVCFGFNSSENCI